MALDLSGYDVVDFGCSDGGSLRFAFEHLGCGTGIGVDISVDKVERARERGYEAAVADLTRAGLFEGRARIGMLSHFLEHLPGMREAEQALATAARTVSEFFLVRQPWFDSDGMLAREGLKLYWSDWSGHCNHMTSLQLYLVLKRLLDAGEIASFSVFGHLPVTRSSYKVVLPIDAARDRHAYDPLLDPPKFDFPLKFPCYSELVAFVGCRPEVDTSDLFSPFEKYDRLFHRTLRAERDWGK